MIALSTSTAPNDLQFLAGSLTPSLLVWAANPRHDRQRRSQRQPVSGLGPETGVPFPVSGVRRDKPRRRGRISPPVSRRLRAPDARRVAGNGISSQTVRHQ